MPIYKSTANSNQSKKPKRKTDAKKIKIDLKIVFLCVSLLLLVFLALPFNNFVKTFLLGVFGLLAYPLFMTISIICIAFMNKQRYIANKKYLIYLIVCVFLIVFIVHLALTSKISLISYGHYLKRSYHSQTTAGGLLFSLLSYPFIKLVTYVGAYIFSGIALVIFVGLLIDCIVSQKYKKTATGSTFDFKGLSEIKNLSDNDTLITLDSKVAKTKREIAKQKLGMEEYKSTIISSTMPVNAIETTPQSRPQSKEEYKLSSTPDINFKPAPVGTPNDIIVNNKNKFYENKTGKKIKEESEKVKEDEYNIFVQQELDEIWQEDDVKEDISTRSDNGEDYDYTFKNQNEIIEENILPGVVETKQQPPAKPNNVSFVKIDSQSAPIQQKLNFYVKPPVSLLAEVEQADNFEDDSQENIDILEKVLEDFKVPAKVVAVTIGPAVTRYELSMPSGISVKKVQQHADDIAMVLQSNAGVRIEAPIPGKNAVGIEVPNKVIKTVGLREVVESKEFADRANPMSFVLGKDINGDIQFCNLDKMPHLLVAGSTGSGKSVCLNTMLISMIYKSSPQDIRFILIDPKMVEFNVYERLPHLLTPHVITEKNQVVNALNWAISEMERRYEIMRENGVVNLKEYNNLQMVKEDITQKWPYIIIVADELAELMLSNKRELEDKIARLSGKARAAGIHLVLATQRPSVDIVTGIIKVNLPSRIAFSLTSFVDSKTVLDMGGAEKLLGMGDMLYKPNGPQEPKRIQGAFVSSAEVAAVVEFIKKNNQGDFDGDVLNLINKAEQDTLPQIQNNNSGNNFDPILKDVLKWFIEINQASITMIQRRFGVGFSRAARIIDQMEVNGFISAPDGSKPRTILITMDAFKSRFED